jgi:hypothetical protein
MACTRRMKIEKRNDKHRSKPWHARTTRCQPCALLATVRSIRSSRGASRRDDRSVSVPARFGLGAWRRWSSLRRFWCRSRSALHAPVQRLGHAPTGFWREAPRAASIASGRRMPEETFKSIAITARAAVGCCFGRTRMQVERRLRWCRVCCRPILSTGFRTRELAMMLGTDREI